MSHIRQPTTSCDCLNWNFDQRQWVINIRRTLEEQIREDDEIPVCVFTVPKPLKSSHPDAYTPQQLSLGPYHYWHPELHEMERYKLSAAKNLQNQLQSLNFQNLVGHLIKLEPKIRASYHRYLDFNAETLAWMMALDVSFLLEFLQIYSLAETKTLSRLTSRMSHLLDYSKRKSAHHVILRDIAMLENQVPLFVLRKVLEFQFKSVELADDMMISMLIGLCKELFPFKLMELPKAHTILQHSHLLDLFYNIILPKEDEPIDIIEEPEVEIIEPANNIQTEQENEGSGFDSSYVKQLRSEIWNLLSQLNVGPVSVLKNVSSSVISKFILSGKILGILLHLLPSKPNEPANDQSTSINKPPLVEEIAIPSVTELSRSGVCFKPTKGNISTINFNPKNAEFYLPTISLDVNSEIVFRNLVAYEVSNASGHMLFTRYIELMDGIIDTEDDVRLLRERGVILNRLKSDEEVAELWNGMSRNKSIRLTKIPFLDKVIEDVNRYHNSRWTVKIRKFMKQSVFSSWKYLSLFAAVLLLILMAVEAFCSFYSCIRVFHIQINPAAN